MIIDYGIINSLSNGLDKRVLRNELISSNIANVDTPGYKSKDINFSSVLKNAVDDIELKRTDPRHISDNGSMGDKTRIVENTNAGRADGNNVNIENEMLKLTENNIQYNVSVHFVARKLMEIKDAIKDAARN